jgi:hypothetical protein
MLPLLYTSVTLVPGLPGTMDRAALLPRNKCTIIQHRRQGGAIRNYLKTAQEVVN